MKTIADQSQMRINLIGKPLDISFRSGKTRDGRDYESATVTLRTVQTYGGREEVSETQIGFFGTPFTSTGKPNPSFATIQALKNLETAQTVGLENAPTIQCQGGSIQENNFVSRTTGNLISTFQINASFVAKVNMADAAAFTIDIFIMDMHPEEDKEGDPTGRLIIKGGVVQYGGKLDVLEFIVEEPNTVEYIERNWNINDTVTVKGRIRSTSVEEKTSGKESSWGEDIPEVTTRSVRELIITKGDDQGKDEDFAYDPVEIKKAFNVRKAKIEQMRLESGSKSVTTTSTASNKKYDWE